MNGQSQWQCFVAVNNRNDFDKDIISKPDLEHKRSIVGSSSHSPVDVPASDWKSSGFVALCKKPEIEERIRRYD